MSLSGRSSVITIEERKPLHNDNRAKVGADTNIKPSRTTTNWLLRRIHILSWITTYDCNKAVADLIAGVTLGVTIIPQSIAYASLAGVSSQYGLYSAFIGSFAYVIFGTIPQVSVGPTSLMALLVYKFTKDLPIEFTIMLAFVSGVVEIIMGVFNLGFIVNFISNPVTSAFTTGTSAIIILTQINNLMGIKSKNRDMNPLNLMKLATPADCILGFTCIVLLLLLRQVNTFKFETNNNFKKFMKKCLWCISISRNGIVVFCSSLLAYHLFNSNDRNFVPFALSKKVNSTMPSMQLPPFVIKHENMSYSLLDICYELGSAILVVPIVAVLANVAIAKSFVKDKTIDASQEMLTLGICNIAGSFFSAMPTCGAFTRSAVSEASGVRTPMAGIYTGGLVLLALGILTPYFEFIPRSTLSAVLITAVVFMIDFKTLKDLWGKNKTDFCIWIGVFIICITLSVEIGLLFGIAVNITSIIIRLANPKIDGIVRNLNGYSIICVTPSCEIYYSGADHLRNVIKSICSDNDYMYPVLIDCQKLNQSDYTLLHVLKTIIRELEEKNVQVYLQSVHLETANILCESKNRVIFCNSEMELQKSIAENSVTFKKE